MLVGQLVFVSFYSNQPRIPPSKERRLKQRPRFLKDLRLGGLSLTMICDCTLKSEWLIHNQLTYQAYQEHLLQQQREWIVLNSFCLLPSPTHVKETQPCNEGFWTEEEDLMYVDFLQTNLFLFSKRNKSARYNKPYVKMSKIIGTRTSEQCRSHHQKKLRTYRTLPNIINRTLRDLAQRSHVEPKCEVRSSDNEFASTISQRDERTEEKGLKQECSSQTTSEFGDENDDHSQQPQPQDLHSKEVGQVKLQQV